jgi:hypothetical protein
VASRQLGGGGDDRIGGESACEEGWGGDDAAYPGGMDSSFWTAVFWSLAPTVVVSVLFFYVLRSVIRADRTERRVYARIEAEERAKRGLPPVAAQKPAASSER